MVQKKKNMGGREGGEKGTPLLGLKGYMLVTWTKGVYASDRVGF